MQLADANVKWYEGGLAASWHFIISGPSLELRQQLEVTHILPAVHSHHAFILVCIDQHSVAEVWKEEGAGVVYQGALSAS